MADARLQGGDWALLGFYYQMVATLGLGVLNNEPLQAADDDTRLLVATFTTDKKAVFDFEYGGQDVAITSGEKCLLFQAKHSGNPANAFDQSGFRKLLTSFADSLKHVDEQGGSAICGCILLTNRIPHEALKSIKNIIQECRNALGWAGTQANGLPTKSDKYAKLSVKFDEGECSHDGSLKDLVKLWLTNFDKDKNTKGEPPTAKQIEYALRALPGLYFVTEAHQHHFEQEFTKFAEKYGALPDEINNAKYGLLGRLISGINVKQPLTISDFVAAITKHREARELTPQGVGQHCVQKWDKWCKECTARPDWIAFRSDIQSDFEQALQEGKRLIFLIGDGGCGKTELLTQLTQSRIDMLRNGNSFDGFVVLANCSDLQSQWLSKAVGEWANRGIAAEQSLDQPYTRLTIANPDAKHLLFVGFDGLDENFPDESVLKRTIEDVRIRSSNDESRKDVCLIMTSRGREYKNIHQFINRKGRSSYIDAEDDIALIYVNELKAQDVQAVVEKGTQIRITEYAAWDQVGSVETNDVPVSLEAAFNARDLRISPEKDDFIESLKHPRLLGAFVDVGQHEAGVAESALRGDVAARNKVANAFIRQFLSKYDHRRKRSDQPSINHFAMLICKVAQSTLYSPVTLTEDEWCSIAVLSGIVRDHEAGELFEEAASGGLISIRDENADNREWRWKHPFVAKYLATTNFRKTLP